MFLSNRLVVVSTSNSIIRTQVIFARICYSISARLVLDTPEIVDLCVIKCVESAKIWCVRKLDYLLSVDDSFYINSFDF